MCVCVCVCPLCSLLAIIRALTDTYRGSIVTNDLESILNGKMVDSIKVLLNASGFKVLLVRNTFLVPWEDGYRDINFRITDKKNQDLVGELQVHYCPVKKFTELIGHEAYEIIREIPDDDPTKPMVRQSLNRLTRRGYDKVMRERQEGCISSLSTVHE